MSLAQVLTCTYSRERASMRNMSKCRPYPACLCTTQKSSNKKVRRATAQNFEKKLKVIPAPDLPTNTRHPQINRERAKRAEGRAASETLSRLLTNTGHAAKQYFLSFFRKGRSHMWYPVLQSLGGPLSQIQFVLEFPHSFNRDS